MEGLLIAEQLRKLEPILPSGRQSWRFPDAYSFILPLAQKALWLYLKPPHAHLAVRDDFPPPEPARSNFQELLQARAGGPLERVQQLKLDRVVQFYFGAAKGFVEQPPVVLIAELTGRNCNLILTDTDNRILGVAREIGSEINRYRQLRPGIRYQPPPPYDKLDPRDASDNALREALSGKTLKQLRKYLDGVGPALTEALTAHVGWPLDKRLESADIDTLLPALRRLAKHPSQLLEDSQGKLELSTLRRQEAHQERRARLREALEKHLQVLNKRVADVEKTHDAAHESGELRKQANVLMAFQYQVPDNASEASLHDFEGRALSIPLDPALSAAKNAEKLFDRAKRREQRAQDAEKRLPAIERERREVETSLHALDDLNEEVLERLSQRYLDKPKRQYRAEPYIRYQSPHGFSVLVGRNAKGNDVLTSKVAKSRDVWLHAQGYPGSHVVIQAKNQDIPFETILFAAQLAAAYSKASDSDNVPVDYTLRKHVWKVKGGAPGAVNYTQQKTVFVTPNRRPVNSVE